MKPVTYRAECPCGWRGRKLRDPNGAVASAEAHHGMDRERIPCREDRNLFEMRIAEYDGSGRVRHHRV